MLLMPHPDTDIMPLPFFMWFCHHLTNIRGLESGSLFFVFFLNLEVRQTLSQIPNKITRYQKNVLKKSDSWERQLKSVIVVVGCVFFLQSHGVRSGVVWLHFSFTHLKESQKVWWMDQEVIISRVNCFYIGLITLIILYKHTMTNMDLQYFIMCE